MKKEIVLSDPDRRILTQMIDKPVSNQINMDNQ
jgi:hypothetical protein